MNKRLLRRQRREKHAQIREIGREISAFHASAGAPAHMARHRLVPAELAAKLRELAAWLNNQYRLIYEGPPSLTRPASIEIVTTRPDLRVRVMGTPQNQP